MSISYFCTVVTGTSSNRVTTRRDHQTNRLETDEYQSTEEYVTNLPMNDNSSDDYSRISQKSREIDAKQTSYENLDQKAVAEALRQQPSVYDELIIAGQNTNV